MIPEAVAFSVTAGVQPKIGLHAAWIMCLITSLFGGAPGMISGATGAIAVVGREISNSEDVGEEERRKYEEYGRQNTRAYADSIRLNGNSSDSNESSNSHIDYQISPLSLLFLAMITTGTIQILLALFQIHRLLNFVTLPVKIGFLNGLAILVLNAQTGHFRPPISPGSKDKHSGLNFLNFGVPNDTFIMMILLICITILVNFIPQMKCIRDSKNEKMKSLVGKLPMALISIVITTSVEWMLRGILGIVYSTDDNNSDSNGTRPPFAYFHHSGGTPLLRDFAPLESGLGLPCPIIYRSWGEIHEGLSEAWPFYVAGSDKNKSGEEYMPQLWEILKGPFEWMFSSSSEPKFHNPVSLPWSIWSKILRISLIMACVGLTESLMTLKKIQEITSGQTQESRDLLKQKGIQPTAVLYLAGMRECLAQGLANILSGLFGTMGGCALFGQSLMNASSGGNSRMGGVIAALGTLTIILILGKLMGLVPMASLAGVMVVVCYHTFDWLSLSAGYRAFFRRGEVKEELEGEETDSASSESDKKSTATAGGSTKVLLEGVTVVVDTDSDAVATSPNFIKTDNESGSAFTNKEINLSESDSKNKSDSSEESSEPAPEFRHELTRSDIIVIVLVMFLAIFTDLAQAVAVGCIVSNLERFVRRKVKQRKNLKSEANKEAELDSDDVHVDNETALDSEIYESQPLLSSHGLESTDDNQRSIV